jgi:excisionase family DNA binding protein
MNGVERVAFNPAEAAEALGLSRTQVYRLIKNGELRARHCGTRVLIPCRALDEYLNEEGGSRKSRQPVTTDHSTHCHGHG